MIINFLFFSFLFPFYFKPNAFANVCQPLLLRVCVCIYIPIYIHTYILCCLPFLPILTMINLPKYRLNHILLCIVWLIGNWHVLYTVFYLEPETEMGNVPPASNKLASSGAAAAASYPPVNHRNQVESSANFMPSRNHQSLLLLLMMRFGGMAHDAHATHSFDQSIQSIDDDIIVNINPRDTIKFHFDKEITSNPFYLRLLPNSAVFIGWLFGSTWVGNASDKKGRRAGVFQAFTLLVIGLFIQILSGFHVLFGRSWISYWIFLFGRFVMGSGVGGNSVGCYVWGMEWFNHGFKTSLHLDALNTPDNSVSGGDNENVLIPTGKADEAPLLLGNNDPNTNTALSRESDEAILMTRKIEKASSYAGALFQLFWSLGGVLLSGIALVFRHWMSMLGFLLFVDICFGVLVFKLVGESPLWLEKHDELISSFSNEIDVNSSDMDEMSADDTTETLRSLPPKNMTFFSLFRPPFLYITFALAVLWFSNAFTYYGLSLNASHLPGNPYLVSMLLSIVSMPGQLASIWVVSIWGSGKGVVSSLGLSGFLFLLCVLTPYIQISWMDPNKLKELHETIITSLSIAAEPLLTLAFTLCYMITTDVYPTIIRNRGTALGVLMGRLGAIACPLIVVGGESEENKIGTMGMALLCLICWIGASSVLFIWKDLKKSPEESSFTIVHTESNSAQFAESSSREKSQKFEPALVNRKPRRRNSG